MSVMDRLGSPCIWPPCTSIDNRTEPTEGHNATVRSVQDALASRVEQLLRDVHRGILHRKGVEHQRTDISRTLFGDSSLCSHSLL